MVIGDVLATAPDLDHDGPVYLTLPITIPASLPGLFLSRVPLVYTFSLSLSISLSSMSSRSERFTGGFYTLNSIYYSHRDPIEFLHHTFYACHDLYIQGNGPYNPLHYPYIYMLSVSHCSIITPITLSR